MADLIGQRLGNYEILSLLGEGGMATVYRARQLNMRRDVAIKVIESRLARNPDFLKRFEREANTVAELSHAHILKVFDYGQQDDAVYLVMELLRGGSLAEKMRPGRLPLDTIRRIIEQLASALDYAHRRGIIHRDLKPQNVLFDDEGSPYLTDFGIAKVINETTALTQNGVSMGTPAYMSPEQCRGVGVDSRSDVYAIGVMLFEMLAGRVPFQGDTPVSMVYMHLQEPPPKILSIRADLPQAVEGVLDKALAKAPEQRFQTAGDMAQAFSATMTGIKISTPPNEGSLEGIRNPDDVTSLHHTPPSEPLNAPKDEATPQPRRRIALMLTGAVLVPAIVGLSVLFVTSRGDSAALTATTTARADAPSETAPVVAAVPSNTSTESPSDTPVIVAQTARPSETGTATPTRTSTATPSQSATDVPIVPATETPTVDVRAAALATLNVGATLTATNWTATPTADLLGTINAELTAIIRETQTAGDTATAIVVASYTKTSTPAATSTRTFMPPPTTQPTETVIATPSIVTANDQWTPVVQSFDSVEMVQVPAGCFMMGSSDAEVDAAFQLCEVSYGSGQCLREWFSAEQPSHQVCFDQPFWMDRTEVTNAQFSQFGGMAAYASHWTDADRPRERISWFEARDFCAKRGARLPTEAEWEYAARGPDRLVYPWGDAFDGSRQNYCDSNCEFEWKDTAADDGYQYTSRVGSYPAGASWVGALDLSGNVWEWVTDWYGAYNAGEVNDPRGPSIGQSHVLRSGSWSASQTHMRAASRGGFDPGSQDDVGFRCVRSLDALAQTAPEPATETPAVGTTSEQQTPARLSLTPTETSIAIPTSAIIYEFSIEDGYLGGWASGLGNREAVRTENGYALRLVGDTYSTFQLPENVTDYAFEAKVEFIGSGPLVPKLYVRVVPHSGGDGFYVFALHTGDEPALALGHDRCCPPESYWIDAPRYDVPLESGKWYTMRLEAQGNELRAYLDDVLVLQGSDDRQDVAVSNIIGIGTGSDISRLTGEFYFKEIRVWALD